MGKWMVDGLGKYNIYYTELYWFIADFIIVY